MQNRLFKIGISFLSSIIMVSCVTPQPVIRIVPKETKTTWEQGKEFTSYQKGDFIVHCAYHGSDMNNLIFDVEVVNNSQEDFLVAPENFVMYTDSGKWDPVSNQLVYSTFPIHANDPEYELLKLDMDQSVTEAKIKNSQTVAAVAAVAAIPVLIATAAADANDERPQVITRTDVAATATIGVVNGVDAEQGNNYYQIDAINDNRDAWIHNSLRKTTLSPGESVRGLIYFKKPDFTQYHDLRIDAPIGGNDNISFKYKILVYQPILNQ